MRSVSQTALSCLLCLVLSGMAFWQWRYGDFNALLGAPPVPTGESLYPGFVPSGVRKIEISGAAIQATFVKQAHGWQVVSPWQDRMAPEAAIGIIRFVAGLKALDHADRDEVDEGQSGFGKSAIRVRLLGERDGPLADFRIGRTAPWRVEMPDGAESVASVYVQKLERHHKQYIYVGSGDIGPLFREGFRFLRDHQPFYFHPAWLRSIRIRSENGELTLAREGPETAWRILKPLDLPTDATAMKKLLEGLLSLRATRLSERSEVSLPAVEDVAKSTLIALTGFHGPQETVLEILPAESADAREVKATVSDRPGTVFHLASKPETGLVTLANLPLSVNELRDPALTHLQVASLRGIAIEPSTAAGILLTREGRQPWQATIDGVTQPANEENLYALLQAVTNARALSFESDAVTDFTPYGLARPLVTVRFLGVDNQAFDLRFGMDGQGNVFANRLATPSVMRVERTLLDAIPIHAHEWRHSRLWSFHRMNLLGMDRTLGGQRLGLVYDSLAESWKATRDGEEVSGELNTDRADYLLGVLEELRVSRWLAADDLDAAAALVRPTLGFRIFSRHLDDDGNFVSSGDDRLEFAPVPGPQVTHYFGRRHAERNFFLITRETYDKLALDLLDGSVPVAR